MKAADLFGGLLEHLDSFDPCPLGTLATEFHQRCNGVGGPFEDGFDNAAFQVANPPLDSSAQRVLAGGIPEEDPLHAPVHQQPAAATIRGAGRAQLSASGA